MPFDGNVILTRLEKLERLKMLADKATGSQYSFCTCLHHDARLDPVLAATGIPSMSDHIPSGAEGDEEWDRLSAWLGPDQNDEEPVVIRLFGLRALKYKRRYLATLIARERSR